MEQSPYWEANSRSSGQQIPRILCNPKVQNFFHKSPLTPSHSPKTEDEIPCVAFVVNKFSLQIWRYLREKEVDCGDLEAGGREMKHQGRT
jgi:hypothetical protein